ncbi:MAG: hypothetical protein CVV52_13305 [Spirochaetae bacterium HGW-Spirochaetae-8]|nr:MAG: hypothetical protein CVV52_13305 [Spirochaetae bacterium HGW-Spirochaetae-8]
MRPSIEAKLKKGNSILFTKDSECLQELIHLIELQNHRTLVLWVFDCVRSTLAAFEAKYPLETRPRKAVELGEAWARGTIKMQVAKKAILDAHAVAKELDDKEAIALVHAIGQGVSTVHVGTHALGLVVYELSALVYKYGAVNCEAVVRDKIAYYEQRLRYWQENSATVSVPWADFLADGR